MDGGTDAALRGGTGRRRWVDGSGVGVGRERQVLVAPDEVAGRERASLVVDDEPGAPHQQLFEGDPGLQSSRRRPEAVVGAVAEREQVVDGRGSTSSSSAVGPNSRGSRLAAA